MPLVIVTQSRGDAHRLAEWVTYHTALGFQEFHVALDGLIDDSDEVLQSLDVGARVVVHRYPEEGVYYDGLPPDRRMQVVQEWRRDNAEMLASLGHKAVDPQALRQRRRMSEILDQVTDGRRGWVAHIDSDEFMHLPGGGRSGTSPRLPRHRGCSSSASTSTPPATTRPCRCWGSTESVGHARTSRPIRTVVGRPG